MVGFLVAELSGTATLLLLGGVVAVIVVVLVAATFLARAKPPEARTVVGEVIDAPLYMTLRFLAQDKATARLSVASKSGAGELYMAAGRLVHASTPSGTTGDRAVSEVLRWDPSVTTVTVMRDAPIPAARTVTMALPDLFRAAGVSN